MTATPRPPLLAALAALAALALVVVWLRTTSHGRAEVVDVSPSQQEWRTVQLEGVRVDIPTGWHRPDVRECEFRYERWAPLASPPCDFEEAVAVHGSATFCPAHGPGVRRTTDNGTATWGGYTYVGDHVVWAASQDRAVVEQVLASARQGRPPLSGHRASPPRGTPARTAPGPPHR